MVSKCHKAAVTPGVCPPEGCPPFDRIECIVVEKVYDSCFQVDQRTRDIIVTTDAAGSFPTGPFAVGDVVGCGLTAGLDISCTEISRTPTSEPGFYTVALIISVPVTLTNPNAAAETVDTVFTFSKSITLCAPEGTQIGCEGSSLLLCSCVITSIDEGVSITVTCDIQVCVVLMSSLVVQLLVPSYGFCIPAPCVTLPGVCPPSPPEQCY